jgi:integrase
LGVALGDVGQERPEWREGIAAIRLIAVTGARRSEILELCWPEVDFERKEIRKKDSKTGPKTIQLNDPAVAILQGLGLRRRSETWVIPSLSSADKPLRGIAAIWGEVRTRAGLQDVRLHDLRHSLASMGTKAGLNLQVIGGILGQSQVGTTSRYSHLAESTVADASELVGARIAAAMDGGQGGVILPIARGQS